MNTALTIWNVPKKIMQLMNVRIIAVSFFMLFLNAYPASLFVEFGCRSTLTGHLIRYANKIACIDVILSIFLDEQDENGCFVRLCCVICGRKDCC